MPLHNAVYGTAVRAAEEDVFAWRTLFETAPRLLEFSLSSGLAGGEKKEGEEPHWGT